MSQQGPEKSGTSPSKRGRPKGSKTEKGRRVILEMPQGCPKCGCTEFVTTNKAWKKQLRNFTRQISSRIRRGLPHAGEKYTHVTYRYKFCKACKTKVDVMTYSHDGREN